MRWGADRVRCVMLPSRYTSRESLEDADACARLLGVRYETVEIERAVEAMGETLARALRRNTDADTTEENIQSRLRGVILMAISNKFGPMVLTTGNKSEMSVGYATLYGDMCGGYNVLKDIYKTEVFALSRWRNANSPAGRAGAARARDPRAHHRQAANGGTARQPDRPGYAAALRHTGRHPRMPGGAGDAVSSETVAKGFDPATVKRVEQLLYMSEYKRRQAPPGVKISVAQFRPRPALSHHQCFSGCALMTVTVRFAPSPTGLCMSAMPAPRCSTVCSRRKMGGKFLLRIDDTDAARSTKAFEEAIYRDLGWLGLTHDARRPPDRPAGDLQRRFRAAAGGGPALSLLRDRGGTGAAAFACWPRAGSRRSMTVRRSIPAMPRTKWEAEGRKPHWRFKLSAQQGPLDTIWCAGRWRSTPPPCPIRCWCARMAPFSIPCRRWWTISISPSAM